jgi:Concanavalin A-like lectin/glucanases superfamily
LRINIHRPKLQPIITESPAKIFSLPFSKWTDGEIQCVMGFLEAVFIDNQQNKNIIEGLLGTTVRQAKPVKINFSRCFVMLWFLAAADAAFALGTAFTYQGQLNDNNQPANGNYDFIFQLASDPQGSNYVGSAVPADDITASNGWFTVTLDFGNSVFTGSNLWLQVSVCTNGSGNFKTLYPLQALTSVPYAVMANTASNLLGSLPTTQLSGQLPASQLSGKIQMAQLPNEILTNNTSGTTLSSGNVSLSNPTLISDYNINMNLVMSQVVGGPLQGVATDGTNYYVFDTGRILKYDHNFSLIAINSSPFAGVSANYSHIGDGSYYGGELYVPMEIYAGCGNATNASIGIFNSSDLSRSSITVISNYQSEISAMTIAPNLGANGIIFTGNYCDGSIHQYDLSTLASLGTMNYTGGDAFYALQGISYYNGILYVMCDSGKNGLLYAVDTASGQEKFINPFVISGQAEWEGIETSQNQLIASEAGTSELLFYSFSTNSIVDKFGDLSASPSALPNNLQNGLQLWWDFHEGAGAYTVGLSTNAFVGNLVNILWTNGVYSGNGIYLNGTNSEVDGGAAICSGNSNLTISIWFKSTNSQAAGTILVARHAGGTNGEYFLNFSNGGGTSLGFTTINANTSRANIVATVPYMLDGNWHNVVGSYDGTTMQLYLDGQLYGAAAQSGSLQKVPLLLKVGAYNSGSNFTGFEDELMIWSRGLNAAEIQKLYNFWSGRPFFQSLVSGGNYFPSNTWSMSVITNSMANFSFWIGNSNGQALISLYLSNGVPYIKQLAP